MFDVLRKDVAKNRGNYKALLILSLYRSAACVYRAKKTFRPAWIIGLPYLVFYRIFVEWILAVEIPWDCDIGPGLMIDHGQGLVINKHAVIGANCRLRNAITIGCKITEDGKQLPSPRIGDNVDIGAGAYIIGDITIGNDATIGAGAVVIKDVPANAVVVGNPARVLRFKGANTH